MAEVDPIVVKIQAEFNEFKKDLGEVKQSIKGLEAEGKKAGDSMAMSFAKGALAIEALKVAMSAAVEGLKSMTTEMAANAREQRLWANRLSVSVESFSALVAVGKRFGAGMDDVGDSIKDLNERIADAARGNKTYEDALNMVGLKSKDLINIPIEDQFIKVADAIGKMTNAGDQNFATAELMADAGFRLLPAFRAGEKGLREMISAVKDLNVSFSEEEVQLYRDYDLSLLRLKESALAASKPISGALVSALTEAANKTADVLEVTNKYAKQLRELREEIAKTASSGNVISSEVGELSTNLDLSTGSFDLLAESVKNAGKEVDIFREMAAGQKAFQMPVIGGGLQTDGDINQMFSEALAGPSLSELFEEQLRSAENQEMSLLDIKRRSEEEKTAIQEQNMRARMALEKMEYDQKMSATRGVFSNLSTLMNTESRKLFEIGKAAAIADATISTYMGATKALGSAPPPFNFALAAAVTAAGMANIANIASTQMGGGGGSAGVGAGAVGGGVAPQAAPEQNIDAVFNIQSQSGLVSTDQLRSIASGLNDLTEDGFKIRSVKVI